MWLLRYINVFRFRFRYIYIYWYRRVSNCEVRRITEEPPLRSIIQKRHLVLFGHLARMDESADARRILTAVPQSDWKSPHTSWLATMKNDLSYHNLSVEDANWAGTGQTTLEVIGSRRSYAVVQAEQWWISSMILLNMCAISLYIVMTVMSMCYELYRLKKVRVCLRSLIYACRVGDVERVVYILGYYLCSVFIHLYIWSCVKLHLLWTTM